MLILTLNKLYNTRTRTRGILRLIAQMKFPPRIDSQCSINNLWDSLLRKPLLDSSTYRIRGKTGVAKIKLSKPPDMIISTRVLSTPEIISTHAGLFNFRGSSRGLTDMEA